jgi:methylenetetrahydrofolate dehydrogenase (NADP+)/methenyltetrahydrofolate cyclohydrolase
MSFWVYNNNKLKMETKIIDGREIRKKILEDIKNEISLLPFQPVFCDVLVGDDSVSRQYVEMKAKTAEKVGIKFHRAEFNKDVTSQSLSEEIQKLGNVLNMCGIIVQLPLPLRFFDDKRKILDSVPEELDVDCLGSKASEKFYRNENEIGFPTALACMTMLDSLNMELKGKNIVVIGQGELVGRPVTTLLKFRGLEPVTVRSNTENKDEIIKNADIIISGIGKGKFITGDMIKEGVVVIDAGTSESNDSKNDYSIKKEIVGDVDFDSVNGIAGYVSKVPGGVGPVTVAMLLNNVLKVAKRKL